MLAIIRRFARWQSQLAKPKFLKRVVKPGESQKRNVKFWEGRGVFCSVEYNLLPSTPLQLSWQAKIRVESPKIPLSTCTSPERRRRNQWRCPPFEQVFDITDLDNIHTGATPLSIDDKITEASNSDDKWDANSLMRSLGVVDSLKLIEILYLLIRQLRQHSPSSHSIRLARPASGECFWRFRHRHYLESVSER
jgi:hypothetical protein